MSHRLPIALAALQQGFEVHIATVLTHHMDKLKTLGLTVHPLSFDRFSTGIISNVRTFFQILRLFMRVRPDVVHLVTIKPVLFGGLAARLAAVPCVVAAISGLGSMFMSHPNIKTTMRRWLIERIYPMVLNHPNLIVIFQNTDDQKTLTTLSRLPKEKVRLIRGSGVDLTRYSPSPLPEGEPVVMLASRLLAFKGVRTFVQAAHELKKNASNVARFVLVGEPDLGNEATISEHELKQWVTEGVIEWWGQHDDIPQIFAASSMVVLPSFYREGLPKVLLEAGACGRAVITTDTPGCRDAIKLNVTGLLVPARDSEALASAIKQLLDNPELCKKMGEAGRKLAERSFDVQQVVAHHICIYDELLQRAS